jgi:hypothetical protein
MLKGARQHQCLGQIQIIDVSAASSVDQQSLRAKMSCVQQYIVHSSQTASQQAGRRWVNQVQCCGGGCGQPGARSLQLD